MSHIRVFSSISHLEHDLDAIRAKAPKELNGVVRDGVKAGTILAKDFAKRSAGRHGKRYPASITSQMRRAVNLVGLGVYSGEYGPDSSRPQGNMSFEYGSRNQPPHLDLAKSADIIGPQFLREVDKVIDGLFW